MNAALKQLEVTVEIKLPAYIRRNLLRRDWVLAQTMDAASQIAPGHFYERRGMGGDEVHLVHVADEATAMKLRLTNDRINRASFRDDLDLDWPGT